MGGGEAESSMQRHLESRGWGQVGPTLQVSGREALS